MCVFYKKTIRYTYIGEVEFSLYICTYVCVLDRWLVSLVSLSLSLSPNVYLSAQRFYITELVVADGTWEHLQSPSPMGGGNGARGHANQPTYPPNNRLTVHTAIHTYMHTL